MARGISLSVRRGLLLLSTLVFFVVRAQTQIAVPGCGGCTVTCVAGPGANPSSRLQVNCATLSAACAQCIGLNSLSAFGQATSLAGNAQGCTAQVGFAATILGECSTASILPTATTSGPGATVSAGSALTTSTGSHF